tara:strand:+ start:52 stop:234 length:183 start_codon:yes stop_codon:yes gene_type:complete
MKKLLKYFKLGLWLIKKRNYYLDLERENEEIREAYAQMCSQNMDLLQEIDKSKMRPFSKR